MDQFFNLKLLKIISQLPKLYNFLKNGKYRIIVRQADSKGKFGQ